MILDDGRTWLILILVVAMLVSCYISAVLSAITHLSDVTLHDKAEDDDAKAVLLDRLMHKTHFLDSVRTLSSFFGCITTLVSGWLLYGVFYDLFSGLWEGMSVGLLGQSPGLLQRWSFPSVLSLLSVKFPDGWAKNTLTHLHFAVFRQPCG